VAPRSPVEKELARIWSEVLKLEQVGIHDNFFNLGGHSLLATQVISRVINTFRVELPLRSLFEAPTIERMAVVITQNQAKKSGPEDLARMLTELESLSEEEAQQHLANERTPRQ
jgi:acyl carrier protein